MFMWPPKGCESNFLWYQKNVMIEISAGIYLPGQVPAFMICLRSRAQFALSELVK